MCCDCWNATGGSLQEPEEVIDNPGGVEEMKKYLIVVEQTNTGFSAYSPDLPGCVSTGRTREDVEQNMREAIAFHLDGLREDGQALPEPNTYSTYVELPA
jgi:predicted RNase H-like HicB family nuclease